MLRTNDSANKNLKDSVKDTTSLPAPYQAVSFGSGSYTKTNKLITALYMVTDIMDKEEPLRNKLRTLGTEIISDIYSISASTSLSGSNQVIIKISETLSFLDIASTINIISPMNCGILKKEFTQLRQSIEESFPSPKLVSGQTNLEDFFREELFLSSNIHKGHNKSIGHNKPTRIGVQKGSTLMKALSDIKPERVAINDFNELKKQRRDQIILIIKNNANMANPDSGGVTITDIKSKVEGSLASFSEKTLQRELVAMVKDNVLYRTGSKRWSRYSLSKVEPTVK